MTFSELVFKLEDFLNGKQDTDIVDEIIDFGETTEDLLIWAEEGSSIEGE